jgi:hypothetical protein
VGQKAGAGGVIGIKKLAPRRGLVPLVVEKALLVRGSQKGRKMVVEPPGNPRRGGVFEIDNGVFVAGKLALVKERAGAVYQAVVLIACPRGDAFTMEAREQRG